MKLPGFNTLHFYTKGSASFTFLVLLVIPAAFFYAFQQSLFYCQEHNSLFIFSEEYLRKYICRPGGLLQYSGLFLTQGYFSPLFGSLAISLIFVLTGKVFFEISKHLTAEKSASTVLIIIPSCILMILQRRPDHLMEFSLGFLLTGLCFLYSIKLNKAYKVLTPLLFAFFFYLAGFFAFILLGMYLAWFIVYERGTYRLIFPALLIFSTFITILTFKQFIFLQPLKLIILNPVQKYYSSGFPALFVLLAEYFILIPVIIKLVAIFKDKIPSGISNMIALFIFSITVFFLTKTHDPEVADNTVLEKMVNNQDWAGVIMHHENLPSTNITGQYYYNIALSETDQLCDRLFKGRQDFGAGSLRLPDNQEIDKQIYYYYATGLINEAHHLAIESFIQNGYRPENIRFIIKTELIRGNYRVAQRFINILKRTLHYRQWALRFEKLLSDPALIETDPELKRRITLLPKGDFFIKPVDSLNIKAVLKYDPANLVAFEYNMARLLFEKDLKTIAREAEKMEEIGYNYMPGYIVEAIVEARFRNHEEVPGRRLLTKEAEARFRQYLDDYNYGKDSPFFEEWMRSKWDNTYWFYYDFR